MLRLTCARAAGTRRAQADRDEALEKVSTLQVGISAAQRLFTQRLLTQRLFTLPLLSSSLAATPPPCGAARAPASISSSQPPPVYPSPAASG
jgi:hypothetical protein